MKISEGLDELRSGILRDEADLAVGPDDHLWQDTSIIRYMNFIQKMWARKTLTLRDGSTPEVVQVLLAEGTGEYTLHPAVRAVISARYDTNQNDLSRVTHPTLAAPVIDTDTWFDVNNLQTTQPGLPLAYSTDEAMDLDTNSAVRLRVFPVPNADADGKKLYMRVARMPLDELKLTNLNARFETPEEHDLNILDGVAWRCYLNDDRDGASAKATACELRFNNAMAEVLREQRAKMFQPVRWDFGRNGFTWSQ